MPRLDLQAGGRAGRAGSRLESGGLIHVDPIPPSPTKVMCASAITLCQDLARRATTISAGRCKPPSNSYFITNGLHIGPASPIVRTGPAAASRRTRRACPPARRPRHLPQPASGSARGWTDGDTGNLCIGQGPVWRHSAANGRYDRGHCQRRQGLAARASWTASNRRTRRSARPTQVFPERARCGISWASSRATWKILHDAMLADVEDADGTGGHGGRAGMRIAARPAPPRCKNVQGALIDQTTWFTSFAPYEKPRYAVVVMVEDGGSGGGTCAPIAQKIYTAILERDRSPTRQSGNAGKGRLNSCLTPTSTNVSRASTGCNWPPWSG